MLNGIDVSHYQKMGTWPADALQRLDIRFAYVKATDGLTFTDPLFEDHVSRAYDAGLQVGAYHVMRFLREKKIVGAQPQAELFLSRLGGQTRLPPALDLETKILKEARKAGCPLLDTVNDWLELVACATRLVPVIYASERGLKILGTKNIRQPVYWWIADHRAVEAPRPIPGVEWLFWQYTSKGDGEDLGFQSEHVDLDYFRGNTSDLLAITVPMIDRPLTVRKP